MHYYTRGFPVGRTSTTTSIHPSIHPTLSNSCRAAGYVDHTRTPLLTTSTQRPGIFLISFSGWKFLSIKSCPGFHCHSAPHPSLQSRAPRSKLSHFHLDADEWMCIARMPFRRTQMIRLCAGVAGKQNTAKTNLLPLLAKTLLPLPTAVPRRTEFG